MRVGDGVGEDLEKVGDSVGAILLAVFDTVMTRDSATELVGALKKKLAKGRMRRCWTGLEME